MGVGGGGVGVPNLNQKNLATSLFNLSLILGGNRSMKIGMELSGKKHKATIRLTAATQSDTNVCGA